MAQRGKLLSMLVQLGHGAARILSGPWTTAAPPLWGQVLDLSSATPTQCDIFTAHAGSVKAWMG